MAIELFTASVAAWDRGMRRQFAGLAVTLAQSAPIAMAYRRSVFRFHSGIVLMSGKSGIQLPRTAQS